VPPAWACCESLTAIHLLGAADVRRLAGQYAIRPSKGRGQNFVHDPNTVRRIVRAADLAPDNVVLEVGPGLGSLTLALLEAGHEVVAVEIDRLLAAALPATIAEFAPDHQHRLRVVEGDAFGVSATDLVADETSNRLPTALVANLPYNVAVPVLLHLLESVPSLERALVMVQQEVADRLAAAPGSRTYGVPSVKAAWYARVRHVGAVSRSVFWPVPNVDSGLVSLERRDPPMTAAERAQVFAVVDAAFAARRKTLRSALASLAGSADEAEHVLVAAGVDPRARGETLSIDAFCRIADQLQGARPARPCPQ
jgi:16S rRNA (adenine1518-N6/adenine1519-N6)-dimethyltransferase